MIALLREVGIDAPSWCWCARGAGGGSTPRRRRWRCSTTRSSTCPAVATWTARRSSRDRASCPPGPGRDGAAGRPARQRRSPRRRCCRRPRTAPCAAGRWRWTPGRGARQRGSDRSPGRRRPSGACTTRRRASARALRQGLERPLPGRDAGQLDLPAIEDRNPPVTVHAVGAGAAARARGGRGRAASCRSPRATPTSCAPTRACRRGGRSCCSAYPWQHEEELRFRLPDGWRSHGGGAACAAGGRRSVRDVFARRGARRMGVARAVVAERHAGTHQRRRLPEFRAFLVEVDAALAGPIGVSATGPVGS